jgi:hypothetical protein
MAIAFNIFIFGSSPNLVADDCSECSSTTWTSEPSTPFNIGDCNFTINYESRQCDDSSGTNRELRVTSIQKLNPACDTISSAEIYNRSLKYLLYSYYQIFDTLNYYDTTKVAFVSAPCLQEADKSGLIEFCSTTYCNRIEYNLTGFSEFTELVGPHTYTANYTLPTNPCGTVMPCGTDVEHVYNIPPGPLHLQLYSNPTEELDCTDDCYWKLDGNSNVDDVYNFIGPTNGEDFIIKAKSDNNGLTERVRVKHNGGIDFKVGDWNNNLPQITFGDGLGSTDPTIMFYRTTGNTGNYAESYPFWIQENYGSTGGLRFMNQADNGFKANIGQETPTTRLKINYNGNVGVNKEVPTTRFQVTGGNVLFDGNTTSSYDNIPSGAGNRFMWVAEKSALRAGEVTGTHWNNSNIGTHSAAFGFDNIASGNYSIVAGDSNVVSGLSSGATGHGNEVSGNSSFAIGNGNEIEGDRNLSVGLNNYINDSEEIIVVGEGNNVDGYQSQVFGWNNTVNNYASWSNFITGWGNVTTGSENQLLGFKSSINGRYNSIIGYSANIDGDQSHIMGYDIDINDDHSTAIGNQIEIESNNAFAMGNNVKVAASNEGSFIIGDNTEFDDPIYDRTETNEINQMVMRFQGDPNPKYGGANKVFRFITSTDEYGDMETEAFLLREGDGLITTSDRNKKKNINKINEVDILNRMRNIQINSWQWRDKYYYKDSILMLDDFSYTWLGPIAQDFHVQFPEYGSKDSTSLPNNVVSSVMFASIQALADIVDAHSQTITNEKSRIDDLDNYSKELLTKSEFEEFKDDFICLDSVCEKVSTLESNYNKQLDINSTLLTKSDFNSFKDSISCYADACKRIKDLEDTIESLKSRLDELESADTSGSGGPIYNQSIKFNSSDLENRVILEQNNPNPFENESKINYYIPAELKGVAELMLTDEKGNSILKKLEACIGKPCSITISSDNLLTGVYVYSLVLNGKIIKSQKMMIIK